MASPRTTISFTDPVSTMIEAVPLYLLYAFSIVMARFVKPPADDADEPADTLD